MLTKLGNIINSVKCAWEHKLLAPSGRLSRVGQIDKKIQISRLIRRGRFRMKVLVWEEFLKAVRVQCGEEAHEIFWTILEDRRNA